MCANQGVNVPETHGRVNGNFAVFFQEEKIASSSDKLQHSENSHPAFWETT